MLGSVSFNITIDDSIDGLNFSLEYSEYYKPLFYKAIEKFFYQPSTNPMFFWTSHSAYRPFLLT